MNGICPKFYNIYNALTDAIINVGSEPLESETFTVEGWLLYIPATA